MATDRTTVRTAREALELQDLIRGITRPARDRALPLTVAEASLLDSYARRLGETLSRIGSAVIDACSADELAAYQAQRERQLREDEAAARMEADAAKRGCAS